MDKWKCFYCGKEIVEKEKCDCEKSKSGWGYITVNAVKSEKGWKCICGCETFSRVAHMDFSDSYSNTCKCSECGNHIGIHFQRKSSLW